jgi:hypothetical protein
MTPPFQVVFQVETTFVMDRKKEEQLHDTSMRTMLWRDSQ